jgi:para-aminobenzoate synthetase/4-amino-4-deoxychorismate lyase
LLGPGPDAAALLAALPPGDRVALVGSWAAGGTPSSEGVAVGGGGALVTSDPLFVLGPDEPVPDQPDASGDPEFVGGGWFGWLAYDGTHRLAFHDHVFRLRDGQWWFEALWSDERADLLSERRAWIRQWLRGSQARTSTAGGFAVGEFAGPDPESHLAAVEGAVERIRAGELYQVNICTRLTAQFDGDPAALFAQAVRKLNPVYGAYAESGAYAVASMSPELFLRRRGREVSTSPIKGTLPRVPGDHNEAALRASAKDAAENVMIVDLMRNDLGRVCEIGSVRPSALLDVEPHPGVWHLVSTVTGTLRPDVTDSDLIAATFPPGSVTGAPKSRALDVIAALEPVQRVVYTGAIGFSSPLWGAEFNVAIRTFEMRADEITLGVGGGVTADSVPMLEWRECLHKAAPLLAAAGATVSTTLATAEVEPDPALLAGGLLETILALDGHPLRLADHLARLDRSSRELYGRPAPELLRVRVEQAVAGTSGRVAARIVLTPDGRAEVTARPAADRPRLSHAMTSPRAAGLWRHKWALRIPASPLKWPRSGPESVHFGGEGVPEVLYVAPDGAVLETSRGNVFLLATDGTLTTPPLRDDLLPGITRRALLDLARDQGRRVRIRSFGVAELTASAAFWTSSLSVAVPIAALDGVELPRADEAVAVLAAALAPVVARRET